MCKSFFAQGVPARNAALAVAMLPLGLLAGWSNFNTGGVAALLNTLKR